MEQEYDIPHQSDLLPSCPPPRHVWSQPGLERESCRNVNQIRYDKIVSVILGLWRVRVTYLQGRSRSRLNLHLIARPENSL